MTIRNLKKAHADLKAIALPLLLQYRITVRSEDRNDSEFLNTVFAIEGLALPWTLVRQEHERRGLRCAEETEEWKFCVTISAYAQGVRGAIDAEFLASCGILA